MIAMLENVVKDVGNEVARNQKEIVPSFFQDLPNTKFDPNELKRSAVDHVDDNPMRHCPIEGNGGHWTGERGNSTWRPYKDDFPVIYNPDGEQWKQILSRHGIDGIPFRDGEPDFSEISKGTVEIGDFSESRQKNFVQADQALAKQWGCSPAEVRQWRQENGYTWHECRDCKTMQLVPQEIHNNIPHAGGISEMKSKSV